LTAIIIIIISIIIIIIIIIIINNSSTYIYSTGKDTMLNLSKMALVISLFALNFLSVSSSSLTTTAAKEHISRQSLLEAVLILDQHQSSVPILGLANGKIRATAEECASFPLSYTPSDDAQIELNAIDSSSGTIDFAKAPTFISEYDAACNSEGGGSGSTSIYYLSFSTDCPSFANYVSVSDDSVDFIKNVPYCVLNCPSSEGATIIENVFQSSDPACNDSKITSSGSVMAGNVLLGVGALVVTAVMVMM
jgi:hypothetical protein